MAEKVKPGRELDKMVAEAIGWQLGKICDCKEPIYKIPAHSLTCAICEGLILPPFSTDMGAAWRAWEWLEKSQAWDGNRLALVRGFEERIPTVSTYGREGGDFSFLGETYPHAIALAVVEADKWLRK